MPKTLTGEELQLDDGPAHESELFLVDGNNLAYRGFFALPEELQTTDGQPTNALLGFTNMLFKLLSDYTPRGVAVAWDTRPVHRTEISAEYKSERRPMPDLLREQFPHFRPIVEAFGYRNLEFEGWEADDVIATLATRADEAGIRTCVVSTDRDAFQLVSENVCLMMTPRGVADVHVYTPERVELRYGVRPDQVPDFIGLKGDTSDNIPGVPGIGDKTAGQLIAQYGSVESVLEHAGELSPARSRSLIEHAEQARASKLLATMRRDLELDIDLDDVVSRPPDRSQLKEIFRRFEFRALLGRIDTLDDALPAAERPKAESQSVAWREGELPKLRGGANDRAGLAADADRVAVATGSEVIVAARPSNSLLQGDAVAVHDAKGLRLAAARRRPSSHQRPPASTPRTACSAACRCSGPARATPARRAAAPAAVARLRSRRRRRRGPRRPHGSIPKPDASRSIRSRTSSTSSSSRPGVWTDPGARSHTWTVRSKTRMPCACCPHSLHPGDPLEGPAASATIVAAPPPRRWARHPSLRLPDALVIATAAVGKAGSSRHHRPPMASCEGPRSRGHAPDPLTPADGRGLSRTVVGRR